MSKSKNIGTKAETAVVNWGVASGFFPVAERLALRGTQDHGDVRLRPGLIAEIKSGKTAEKASHGLILKWLEECDAEARNSGCYVFLVVKRAGKGDAQVGSWLAVTRMKFMFPDVALDRPVMFLLEDFAILLAERDERAEEVSA